MTAVQIANTVRKALSRAESVTAVAQRTGINRVNLYQFKAGSRDLPLGTLVKLAGALGLEIVVRERR